MSRIEFNEILKQVTSVFEKDKKIVLSNWKQEEEQIEQIKRMY